MSFKLILTDSFYFFKYNFKQIATLCGPFLLASSFINQIISRNIGQTLTPGSVLLITIGVTVAFYPLYKGSLILMMAGQAEGRKPLNVDLISTALTFYIPFLALTVISYCMMAAGVLAFIVPGVWIGIRFSFAKFFLVLEKADPREAILKSVQATKDHFFVILTCITVLAVPFIFFAIFMGSFLHAINAGPPVIALAEAFLNFIGLFFDIVLFRLFMQAAQGRSSGTGISL